MIVNVLGARNRKLTKLLKLAVHFYAKELLTYQVLPFIHIKILIYEKLYDDYLGTCSYIDDSYRPREFEIELKYSDTEIMLESLAHEMVHVRQFVKGQLKERYKKRKRITFWNNKPVYRTYWNQPWEKEAFNLQMLLKILFLEENDDAKFLSGLV